MHELSLAEALIEQATEILKKEHASGVKSITVAIGKLSGVERDAFEFAFPIVAENTLLKESELVIEEIPVKVLCFDCSLTGTAEPPVLQCSRCGSGNVKVVDGRDFTLKSMEIV